MEKQDYYKIKAATLYILEKCGETDFIHLFKTLYFAERQHYAYYGQHIVNDSFCAMPRGPVPSALYDAVKYACGTKHLPADSQLRVIADGLRPGSGECQYFYVAAAESPDMDELSAAEIDSLDQAIAFCRDKDSDTLSTLSHDEAWRTAYETRPSSQIDATLIAKAGGASEGFISYLKERSAIDKLLQS